MPQDVLEELRNASMRNFLQSEEMIIVECECGRSAVLEQGTIDLGYKDESGNRLSRKAAVHMSKYRFRCICGKIFCARCKAEPYHLGKTCSQHKKFKEARHCRYCNTVITNNSNTCDDNTCQQRASIACTKNLICGHQCFGIRGEEICPPCLQESCATQTNEHDFCTVCFTEGLGASPCVILTCGHILHYECVIASLDKKWVGPRITFNFAKCP